MGIASCNTQQKIPSVHGNIEKQGILNQSSLKDRKSMESNSISPSQGPEAREGEALRSKHRTQNKIHPLLHVLFELSVH